MTQLRLALLALPLLGAAGFAHATDTSAEATAWQNVLQTHLSEPHAETGLRTFDYKTFSENASDRAALDAYIDALASRGEPENDAEATAYWANLYNAVTIDVVADEYPVDSIREIRSGLFKPGPWDNDVVTVDGKTLTLNNIEHDILRKRYPSPLIHYMVNCASIGCPNVQPTLWNAVTLDADRDAAAREYVNSPRGVVVSDGEVRVSSIYDWFKADFGGSKSTVMDHLREYADADLAAQIATTKKYSSDFYDWQLNE